MEQRRKQRPKDNEAAMSATMLKATMLKATCCRLHVKSEALLTHHQLQLNPEYKSTFSVNFMPSATLPPPHTHTYPSLMYLSPFVELFVSMVGLLSSSDILRVTFFNQFFELLFFLLMVNCRKFDKIYHIHLFFGSSFFSIGPPFPLVVRFLFPSGWGGVFAHWKGVSPEHLTCVKAYGFPSANLSEIISWSESENDFGLSLTANWRKLRYILLALDVADINMMDKTPVRIISIYRASQDAW